MQNPQSTKSSYGELFTLLINLSIALKLFFVFYCKTIVSDAAFYATAAKNVLSSHWYVLPGLDKPHFMFWIQAVFFKLFGVDASAYILSGIVFTLIGMYYTYLLAKLFYNKNVAILATVICLNSMYIILGAEDIKAEAYLLGTLIPACYYFIRYHLDSKTSNLLLGSIFGAMAIMTKGLFLFGSTLSGIVILLIYTSKFKQIFSKKWLLAYLLIWIFTIPEFIALCMQYGMAGIDFFAWSGSFGRFFGFGTFNPDYSTLPFLDRAYKYISMFFALLVGFLPWTLFLLYPIIKIRNEFKARVETAPNTLNSQQKSVYLLGLLVPTLIVFSCSKVLNNYYITILIPYLSIITANAINDMILDQTQHYHHPFKSLLYFCIGLSISVAIAAIILSIIIKSTIILVSGIIALLLYAMFWKQSNLAIKAITLLSIAINVYTMADITARQQFYQQYDPSYALCKYLDKLPPHSIYLYKFDIERAGLYTNDPMIYTDNLQSLPPKPFYLVIPERKIDDFNQAKLNYELLTRLPYRDYPFPTFGDILSHNVEFDYMKIVLVK